MSLILDTTGKAIANPDTIKITKGFQALSLTTNVPFESLANEKIQIFIQKRGDNVNLTSNGYMKLSDLILLSSCGEAAISYDNAQNLQVLIPLTFQGNIPLSGQEEIHVNIASLDSTKVYKLETIEDPFDAVDVFKFSQHTIAETNLSDVVYVSNADFALIEKTAAIVDVRTKFNDPRYNDVKHTMSELEAIYRHADPIRYIDPLGAVKNLNKYVVLGTIGIASLEVNKTNDDIVTVFTREII